MQSNKSKSLKGWEGGLAPALFNRLRGVHKRSRVRNTKSDMFVCLSGVRRNAFIFWLIVAMQQLIGNTIAANAFCDLENHFCVFNYKLKKQGIVCFAYARVRLTKAGVKTVLGF